MPLTGLTSAALGHLGQAGYGNTTSATHNTSQQNIHHQGTTTNSIFDAVIDLQKEVRSLKVRINELECQLHEKDWLGYDDEEDWI